MQEIMTHPLGESQTKALIPLADPVSVDTFGGRINVEWNLLAPVTPLGQLPFFIDYLHVSGLFDKWVSSCPLQWTSPNAPAPIDVLGTELLSVLSGLGAMPIAMPYVAMVSIRRCWA